MSKAIKSCPKQTSDHRNGCEIFSDNHREKLADSWQLETGITSIKSSQLTVAIYWNYIDERQWKWTWSKVKVSFSENCKPGVEILCGEWCDVLSTYTGDRGLNLLFFNYSCLKSNLVTVNKYQFPRITWHSPAKNYYICPSTLNTLVNVKCLQSEENFSFVLIIFFADEFFSNNEWKMKKLEFSTKQGFFSNFFHFFHLV